MLVIASCDQALPVTEAKRPRVANSISQVTCPLIRGALAVPVVPPSSFIWSLDDVHASHVHRTVAQQLWKHGPFYFFIYVLINSAGGEGTGTRTAPVRASWLKFARAERNCQHE